ncbi:MAG: response regulator [Lachnospira sp.]|nr:response regulator [Lachnospira sp.]
MNTIIVDYDESARHTLYVMMSDFRRINVIGQFSNAEETLQYVMAERPDLELVILNTQLPKMNGVDLAIRLRELYHDIIIIFEADSDKYAMDAFRMKAAGYMLKPYRKYELDYALESAFLLSKRAKKRIYARTFGHFDLFVDGEPVLFKSAKAKELLALLVDRQGGVVTSEQVIATLWEERPNDEGTQNLASKISRTLKNELDAVSAGNIICLGRGTRNLRVDALDCDLYQFLAGDKQAELKYYGEYMSDYDWGENRIEALNRLIEKK